MKITNIQAVTFVNTVSSIKNKHLPMKVMFAINYNLNLLTNQIKTYEEARKELMGEGTEQELLMNPEFHKLLDESVEQPIKTVKIEELEKFDTDKRFDKLSLAELSAIEFIVDMEEK